MLFEGGGKGYITEENGSQKLNNEDGSLFVKSQLQIKIANTPFVITNIAIKKMFGIERLNSQPQAQT